MGQEAKNFLMSRCAQRDVSINLDLRDKATGCQLAPMPDSNTPFMRVSQDVECRDVTGEDAASLSEIP